MSKRLKLIAVLLFLSTLAVVVVVGVLEHLRQQEEEDNGGKEASLLRGEYSSGVLITDERAVSKDNQPQFKPFSSNSTCPLVFGLGHQKSGTTAIVFALGHIANLTARNDIKSFWMERSMNDSQLLNVLHRKHGFIRKEGHALVYARNISRVCPETRFYYVKRDMLQTVRSVADRLQMNANSTCTNLPRQLKIPSGWKSLFKESNDTSCLIRVARHYLHYHRRFKEFERTLPYYVPFIDYQHFALNQSESVQQLCLSLDLENCHQTVIEHKQYQKPGENREKQLSEIWPVSLLEELEQLQADEIQRASS